MQIQPDYIHQLSGEIAKALSSIPQWVVALTSGLFGVLLGIAGKWLSKVFDNWWDIHKMRRVLYLDLLTMFETVESIHFFSGIEGAELELEESLKELKFDGEAYLKGHRDVYMQLPERLVAERLYAAYHRILDPPASEDLDGSDFAREAKDLLADLVEKNQLRRKYIKKFASSVLRHKSC